MTPTGELQVEVSRKEVMTAKGGTTQGVAWMVDTQMIERARIRRGWTRAQLARAAHVDPRTVSSLVVGRRRPSLGSVQALCTALGLLLADLIVFLEPSEAQAALLDADADVNGGHRDAADRGHRSLDELRERRSRARRAWARSSSYSSADVTNRLRVESK